MDYHEKSQNWTAVCEYVDHGLLKPPKLLPMVYYVVKSSNVKQSWIITFLNTLHGVEKRQSEEQMAVFLKDNGILFDRDRENTLHFNHCQNVDPNPHPKANKARIRPDFYLTDMSVELGCHILIGNDEVRILKELV
jgi:hypothetical protein